MAETKHEKKVHGIVAEYTSVDALLAACRRIRDAGYTKTDAFTPFPVHGIDQALGIRPTVLPWIALIGGIVGAVSGMAMQIWMIGIDYPYIISGKPYISLPAFVPISFELTILFASFCAFFGMWALNGLPKFSNPMFTSPRFDRATDDTFFLYIDAADPRYDEAGVQQLLSDAGGQQIDKVVDDDTSTAVPRNLVVILAVVIAVSLIPALLVANMRVATSESPRFHIFFDMDLSPAKDAQQTTTLFPNDLAMRPEVPGTVNRGEMTADLDHLTGIDMEALAQLDAERAERTARLVAAYPQQDAEEQDDAGQQPAGEANEQAETQQQDGAEPAEGASGEAGEEEAPSAGEPAEGEPAGADEQQDAADEQPAEGDQPEQPADAAEPPQPESEPPQPAEAAEQQQQQQQQAQQTAEDNTPWLEENPLELTAETLRRGQAQFEIYCAACHGIDGRGDGLVSRRARRILAPTWTPPANLHDETLSADQYAEGKLFNTISYGIRKMPGYASQMTPRDRWAVVGYVRALQRSQDASLDQVPGDLREEISAEQAEVQQRLREQAEQEQQEQAEQTASEAT